MISLIEKWKWKYQIKFTLYFISFYVLTIWLNYQYSLLYRFMPFELQFEFNPNGTSRKQEGSLWKKKKNFEAYHIKSWSFMNVIISVQKTAKQLYWNCTSTWEFCFKFATYFHTPFSKNTSGRLPLTWNFQR